MKIAIGCDHGGLILKSSIKRLLNERGIEYIDFGTNVAESVDYPDYAIQVAEAILKGEVDAGIVLCGTGIGISIAANKVKGIRAAVCHDAFTAEMCKAHNNANIIALGGRVVSAEQAAEYVRIWLDTKFEGGRHQNRLNKVADIENKYFK